MAETLNVGISVSGAAGTLISQQITATDSLLTALSVPIPANTANQAINMSFPHANITVLALTADQAVSINTNTWNAVNGNTLNISQATPQVWYPNSGSANPITHDVAVMYGNNTGNVNANVTIVLIYH